MCLRPLTYVFGALLLVGATPGHCQELPKMVAEVLGAPGPGETRNAFRILFQRAGASGLKNLRLSDSDTIALQAAWQEVCLTIPEKEQPTRVRPAADKVQWFLGFLEGRGHLQIPDWWRDGMLRADAYSRAQPLSFDHGAKPFYHDAGLRRIQAPLDTTLKREAGSILASVGKERVRLPSALVEETSNISVLITSTRCYVARHHSGHYSYPLIAVARDSGQILWKTEVWGDSYVLIFALTGHSAQRVSITEQRGRVVVFGAGLSDFHVEALSARDGRNLFRLTGTMAINH